MMNDRYAITEAIPELAGRLGDGQRVPVLRDLVGSSYVRQERDGLLVGPYEEVCERTGLRAHVAASLAP